MAGRRRRVPNDNEAGGRERDLRDIEMDDLRRQVQQLQQRLEHYENQEHDEIHHESQNEEEINPFHQALSESSSEEAAPRHQPRRRQGFQRDYDIKVDIPEFEGRIQGVSSSIGLTLLNEFLITKMYRVVKR